MSDNPETRAIPVSLPAREEEAAGGILTLAVTSQPTRLIDIIRADDLLHLVISGINIRIDRSPLPANPATLVRDVPAQDAFLIVEFPSQHLVEEAFPLTAQNEAPIPIHFSAQTRISAPTRMVFTMPAELNSVPLAVGDLLRIFRQSPQNDAWKLHVAPTATPPGLPPPQGTPVLAPLPGETALELPYRLILSPDGFAVWNHALDPVTHLDPVKSRPHTEIWHTRLGGRNDGTVPGTVRGDVDETRATLRAIWTRDPDNPTPDADPFPNRMALTAANRLALHKQMTAFDRTDRFQGDPPIIQVNRLFLSTLGASTDLRYLAPTPANLVTGESWVSQWRHQMALGRDQYVRVVEEGYLFPFGHRAMRINITERVFESTPVAAPDNSERITGLRQSTLIILTEPSKTYLPSDQSKETSTHRTVPFASIRITTDSALITRQSLQGTALKETDGDQPFWPQIGDGAGQKDLEFAITAVDRIGRACTFTAPMIFVSRASTASADTLKRVADSYNGISNSAIQTVSRVRRDLSNQAIALAHTFVAGSDDTRLDVQTIRFTGALGDLAAESLDLASPFFPQLGDATVNLPAIAALTGKTGKETVTTIQMAKTYLDNAYDALGNRAAIFAELPTTLSPTFPGNMAGGVAVPNLNIQGISPLLGAVGDLQNLNAGAFDPLKYFADTSKLLGTISLKEVINEVTGLARDRFLTSSSSPESSLLPRIRTHQIVDKNGLPTAIETEVTWSSTITKTVGFFRPRDGASLTLNAKFTQRLDSLQAPTYNVLGTLSSFEITLFSVLTIEFEQVRFQSQSGQKMQLSPSVSGVKFLPDGPLALVNDLSKFLSTGGSGPSIDFLEGLLQASYGFSLPSVGFGAFSLQNILLKMSIGLPLDGQNPLRFGFSFGERNNPFLVSVGIFGGGGYLSLDLTPAGLSRLEAALEFGGYAALDIGVASGCVYLMAGIRFFLQKNIQTNTTTVALEGYLRCGGLLQILGLVSMSLTFYMGLTYIKTADGSALWGQARLTVSIKIAFFSVSVTLEVERRFTGSASAPAPQALQDRIDLLALEAVPVRPNGSPDFQTLMPDTAWAAYCEAFG